jgi:hypothetical protein
MSNENGATEMILALEGGRVIFRFKEPKLWVAFDPQNAMAVSGRMARMAYEAHTGKPAPDGHAMERQVQSKLTEQMRDRMIARVTLMLPSLLEKGRTPGYIAMEIVDQIFSAVEA